MAHKTHQQQLTGGLKNTTAIGALPPETNASKGGEPSDTAPQVRDNMDPKQAAEYLGLSTSYLTKLRMAGYTSRSGPDFVKIGRVVIYRRSDLDAWLEANRVTTDAGA